jgi:hypothetical protein
MNDPVDGADPWGIIPSFVLPKNGTFGFSVPALITGTGLGGQSPLPPIPPCGTLRALSVCLTRSS